MHGFRLLQPSVIYMDGAEKPFLKKVPKTDKTDPKRLKKDLPKLVKSISAEDQVIILTRNNFAGKHNLQRIGKGTIDCIIHRLQPSYNNVFYFQKFHNSLFSKLFIWLIYGYKKSLE